MCIISNSRQFIFVHLHKCGGTSVKRAVDPHLQWNDLMLGGTRDGNTLEAVYRPRFGLEKHSSAKTIRDIVGDATWDAYWTFALVRHPVSLLESYYRWIKTRIRIIAEQKRQSIECHVRDIACGRAEGQHVQWGVTQIYARTSSFSEFVDRGLDQRAFGFGMTQLQQLSDGSEPILDEVFKLEQIEDLANAFPRRVGIELQLHRHNQADPEALEWDREVLGRVRTVYAADLSAFGYS